MDRCDTMFCRCCCCMIFSPKAGHKEPLVEDDASSLPMGYCPTTGPGGCSGLLSRDSVGGEGWRLETQQWPEPPTAANCTCDRLNRVRTSSGLTCSTPAALQLPDVSQFAPRLQVDPVPLPAPRRARLTGPSQRCAGHPPPHGPAPKVNATAWFIIVEMQASRHQPPAIRSSGDHSTTRNRSGAKRHPQKWDRTERFVLKA